MQVLHARHFCPCCGHDGLQSPPYASFDPVVLRDALQPPYAQHFGTPSYEVCECCGFEFGFDDEPGTAEPASFSQYLAEWIARGAIWFDPDAKPSDWSLEEQLQRANIRKPA